MLKQSEHWEVQQYGRLINKILYQGEKRSSRAGDVYSIYGETMSIDVGQAFPVLMGRKMFYKPVLGELAAMVRGPKNISDFKKFECNYWDSWGGENGEIEVDYGNSWIDFNGVNQLEQLVKTLVENPKDRRMIVTGWRPDRLSELSLPCCHLLYQWYVRKEKFLDMIWYQRSVDTMVGLPSDIILAAAWNIVLASQVGLKPGIVKFFLGDTHIYANHIPQVLEYMRQLQDINKIGIDLVNYRVKNSANILNFVPDMIELGPYDPMPAVKFELNV